MEEALDLSLERILNDDECEDTSHVQKRSFPHEPTKELTWGCGDLLESTSRRSSVCIAIPALKCMPTSLGFYSHSCVDRNGELNNRYLKTITGIALTLTISRRV